MSAWPRRVFKIWEHICGKWPSMGMCSMLILRMCGSWCPCSGGVQTNLNQVAIHANTYGIYPSEIAALQKDYADLWGPLSVLIKKLSEVVEL